MTIRRWLPLALLVSVVLFNAAMLWPEPTISRYPLNDHVFHYPASVAKSADLSTVDAYWNGCCMGAAFWQSYQPLPHYLTALAIRMSPFAPLATFVWSNYLLLCLLPLAMYPLARALGMSQLGAALASVLMMAPAEGGQFGRFGISYGAYVWRGSGLYAQLWGFIVGLPALACAIRTIRTGRGVLWSGLLLGLLAITHVVLAYIAVVTLILYTFVERRRDV